MSSEFRRGAAERLAILAANGSAAIEFRCLARLAETETSIRQTGDPANVGLRISSMSKIELMISRVSQWPATRNKMKKRNLLGLSVIVACGLALLPGSDVSQQKSLKAQLAGTLTLVSVSEAYQDGRKETPWGPAVKGAVSFDPNGKVMLMIIGADLPNPSAKPQESSRQVVAYFGTYAVDDVASAVTYTAERATTPAFDGLARKASVTVDGDELTQKSAPIAGPQGTFVPNLVFKRAK